MAQKKISDKPRLTAIELAKDQKAISISEFFTRNRHLLGFDNPLRALLMTVKEAVDNSIDACDDAKILPEILIEIKKLNEENRFKIIVEDNGPGIVRQNIPNVFGKLLYGSKFHVLKENRGQQGLGISVCLLYAQLTTGKHTKVISKIAPNKPAHYFELNIDTKENEPKILKEEIINWKKDHGTKIEIELEGRYQKGKQSVDEYVKQVAVVNPHTRIVYINPFGEKIEYPRVTKELPIEPKAIKPHPHGVELGMLMQMLGMTKARTIQSFLMNDFCRISSKTAKEICNLSKIPNNARPSRIAKQEVETLFKAIQQVKIMAPPTDCLSPIGEELLLKGLKKEINAEFYTSTTRPPSVYRGMPFQIECAIAYGGDIPKEEQIRLLRFANKVPLLYQQGACAISEAVAETNWKAYGIQQSWRTIPIGPALILIHIASVWVPFTSEAKEAVAHYPEIIKEIKLAVQECGRELGRHINRRAKAHESERKKGYIEKYLPHIGIALKDILDLKEKEEKKVVKVLKDTLERSRT